MGTYAHSMQSGMASIAESMTSPVMGAKPQLRVIEGGQRDVRQPLENAAQGADQAKASAFDLLAPRDGFEPPTNGLTGLRNRSQPGRIERNQARRKRYARQNPVQSTPVHSAGKHSGNILGPWMRDSEGTVATRVAEILGRLWRQGGEASPRSCG